MHENCTLVKTIDKQSSLNIKGKIIPINKNLHVDIYQDDSSRGDFYIYIKSNAGVRKVKFSNTDFDAIEYTNEQLLDSCLEGIASELI